MCMIRFIKDRMSSISSDLYEEILKLNKSHRNSIIQIVPCKTPFRRLIILKNVYVIKVLECSEGRKIESMSVCLTEPNQNYL